MTGQLLIGKLLANLVLVSFFHQAFLARLVVHSCDGFGLGLLVLSHQLARAKFDGQLFDLAGEGEGWLVIFVFHTQAGIDADIE